MDHGLFCQQKILSLPLCFTKPSVVSEQKDLSVKGKVVRQKKRENNDPPPLRASPTIAQLKQHSEEVAKKFKALSCILFVVSDAIFTRIMTCETAKDDWDRLQEEFRGNSRTRQMQVLNLRKEYETLKMKDSESVKEYSDRLMKVVNQIRLLGDDLPDRRVVEKVLISLLEKFEAKISSLEDSRDLSSIILFELVNALQAIEQRRLMRQEEQVERALFVKGKYKTQTSFGVRKHRDEKKKVENNKTAGKSGVYIPCVRCKKSGHSPRWCWYRPNVQCRNCKQFGHVQKVCKNLKEKQTKPQAHMAENQQQHQEEHLFSAINLRPAVVLKLGYWIVDALIT
ncbi:uncharacterized protein LOC111376239 [Olea europaea var. sylvestris]|uniref:uncharacterized protein LOC111376239 n=1 Tax=Olea europaea var. sylvestris TaxID=158386 RepID=UPI000C1D5C1D|nr:uncharacterized protein LOC111376239 [Olea europaea var. sylvestris]